MYCLEFSPQLCLHARILTTEPFCRAELQIYAFPSTKYSKLVGAILSWYVHREKVTYAKVMLPDAPAIQHSHLCAEVNQQEGKWNRDRSNPTGKDDWS
ncbi:MAG TPA: hypothetical protein VFC67_15010 [Prolixibacteraceae bacterium]|nr:hypothetical protein [Prolixibacteraceae bacterium]